MYCENFHTSRYRLPRTNRFREPSSENIANFNTTRTDWCQEAPGKVWEKTSENMFSTPFVYSLVKNHWLQRQSTDAVTSWTNSRLTRIAVIGWSQPIINRHSCPRMPARRRMCVLTIHRLHTLTSLLSSHNTSCALTTHRWIYAHVAYYTIMVVSQCPLDRNSE